MFKTGEVVWAKPATIYGGKRVFWPAKVIENDPLLTRMKIKPVIACVKYLSDNEREAITNDKFLCPFDCEEKLLFINKGRGLKNPILRLEFNTGVKKAEEQKKYIETIQNNELLTLQDTVTSKDTNGIPNVSAEQQLDTATKADNDEKCNNVLEKPVKTNKPNECAPNVSQDKPTSQLVEKVHDDGSVRLEEKVPEKAKESLTELSVQSEKETQHKTPKAKVMHGIVRDRYCTRSHSKLTRRMQRATKSKLKHRPLAKFEMPAENNETMFNNGEDKGENTSSEKEAQNSPKVRSTGRTMLYKGDIVWAKYPTYQKQYKDIYWPAEVQYAVKRKNTDIKYFVSFFPRRTKKREKNVGVSYRNMSLFTYDLNTIEKYRSQSVSEREREDFQEAVEELLKIYERGEPREPRKKEIKIWGMKKNKKRRLGNEKTRRRKQQKALSQTTETESYETSEAGHKSETHLLEHNEKLSSDPTCSKTDSELTTKEAEPVKSHSEGTTKTPEKVHVTRLETSKDTDTSQTKRLLQNRIESGKDNVEPIKDKINTAYTTNTDVEKVKSKNKRPRGRPPKVLSKETQFKSANKIENSSEIRSIDTTLDNFSSDDEESSLPEAFSPTRESSTDFREGDVVWAKFPRAGYWPAQVNIVRKYRRKAAYYVYFLKVKNQHRNTRVAKNNITIFTCDAATMQAFKNQQILEHEKEDFKEALKEAENILMRRVSNKDDSVMNGQLEDEENVSSSKNENVFCKIENTSTSDEGCNMMCSCDSENETKPFSMGKPLENFTNYGQNNNHGDLSDEEDSSCSCDGEMNRKTTSSTDRKRKMENEIAETSYSSMYDRILTDFHTCKTRLLGIFREKVPSARHRKFCGSVSEKNSLKHESGFGPIEDEDVCDQIIDILKSWYGEVKQSFIQLDYIFDVWLPEAMIFFIQKYENVSRVEAERILLDTKRNVPKKRKSEVHLWFKGQTIDEQSREEVLRRARSTFQL